MKKLAPLFLVVMLFLVGCTGTPKIEAPIAQLVFLEEHTSLELQLENEEFGRRFIAKPSEGILMDNLGNRYEVVYTDNTNIDGPISATRRGTLIFPRIDPTNIKVISLTIPVTETNNLLETLAYGAVIAQLMDDKTWTVRVVWKLSEGAFNTPYKGKVE